MPTRYRHARLSTLSASLAILVLTVAFAGPARADSPNDLVPPGSGVYEAMAVLARGGLLPPGSPDAIEFVGLNASLRTRGDLDAMVEAVDDTATMTDRQQTALAYARAALGDAQVTDPRPNFAPGFGTAGVAQMEAGDRSDTGSGRRFFEQPYGDLTAFGTAGANAFYTASLTNEFSLTRSRVPFATVDNGRGDTGNPAALNGIDEAYVTLVGGKGIRGTFGQIQRRWGPGYLGNTMIGDNAPSHPGAQIDAPIWLGHILGLYRFTQFQEAYSNVGRMIYFGARRFDHPIGDRVDLDVQESYSSTRLRDPAIEVLPYYLYQKVFIHNNNEEPNEFNYNVDGALSVRPGGPTGSGLGYVEFFIDDIQAPNGLGLGNYVPRKIGYLAGYNQTIGCTNLVVEYYHTDETTYTKPFPPQVPLGWFSGGLPIGDPAGPNGNLLFGRVAQPLSDRLDIAVEGWLRRRADNDFPAPNDREIDGALSYHVNTAQTVSIRYSDYIEDPFTGSAGSPPPAPAGGADDGEYDRSHLYSVDYLVAF
ncbi:MAG: hypothetical protein ACLQVD_08135 [Capsulimonadaceae bacterium]